MIRITLIIILGLIVASCTDFSDERKKVADLLEQVEADKARLERLHPNTLPMRSADITSRLDKINNDYSEKGRLMSKELGLLLADFKVFTKVFKGLTQKRMQMEEELELTEKQLQNLDKDLKNRALSAEKVREYLDAEQLAVRATSANLDQLDTLLSRGARGYLRMVPKIDSVISSLSTVPSE